MTVLTIDLLKNPEIKDLVTTMQPGDRIKLFGSIKGLTDQTLSVTLTGAKEDDEAVPEEEKEEGADDGDENPPPPAEAVSPGDGLGMLGGEGAAVG